jgi:Nitrate and nitrite sensing
MLRNLPIRSKLIGILIAPLLALTLLTSLGIGANLAIKVQAEHLLQETAFANTLSRLVHELQDERDLTAGWVSGGRAVGSRREVDGQRARVNRALEAFRKDAQALDDDGSSFYGKVQTARAGLGRLAQVRQAAENNAIPTTAQQVLDSYSALIGNLLAVDFEIARNADNHTLTRSVAAFIAMARLGEVSSQERGLLHAVTAAGEFAPGEVQRLSALVGAQDSWRSQLNAAATPEQYAALETLQRADRGQATDYRSQPETDHRQPSGLVSCLDRQDQASPWDRAGPRWRRRRGRRRGSGWRQPPGPDLYGHLDGPLVVDGWPGAADGPVHGPAAADPDRYRQ